MYVSVLLLEWLLQLKCHNNMVIRRWNPKSKMYNIIFIVPLSTILIIIMSSQQYWSTRGYTTITSFMPTRRIQPILQTYDGGYRKRHPSTLSTLLSLLSTTDDNYLSSIDFGLDDFIGPDDVDNDIVNDSETFTVNDNIMNDDELAHLDTDDETILWLRMVEATPRGQLDDKELETLRDILSSYRDNLGGIIADINQSTVVTVERLLLRWVEEYKIRRSSSISSDHRIQPCTKDFVLVMQLWEQLIGSDRARINTYILPIAMEHIKTLLSVLKECYHQPLPPEDSNNSNNDSNAALKPTLDVYRIVLRTLSYSSERQIDRKGEKLFHEMQSDYQIPPDKSTYESLIYMLAKSRNDGAANRAERLLRDAVTTLQQQEPQNDGDSSRNSNIGIDTYNVVITAWAKSGIEYGPERAEQLIHLMSDSGNNMEPNINSFTSLIDAYAQQNTWDSATQCERIFNRVLDLYLNNNDEKALEPSIVSWSVVVSAWGRLAKNGHRGASDRSDKLLRRMEVLHKEQRISYGPDPMLYIKCMNANACGQTMDGLQRGTQILNEMYERYMDGDDAYIPSARSVHVLIENWIRSPLPNKMDEAEAIFNHYKDHIVDNLPDTMERKSALTAIYKAMVIGWAQDGDPILAQECLEEMIDKDLTPDSICFEKIIDSNTQLTTEDHHAMKRSYSVFQLLEECRIQRDDFTPSERAYTSFIRAMTKSRVSNLAQKSYTILQKMEDLYQQGKYSSIMPTVFTYNAVLLSCAESASMTHTDTEQHRSTLRTAVTIFNQLRLGTTIGACVLDNVSCGNMLRCSNLLTADSSTQKDEFISSIFQLCCERGFVNYFILRDLYSVASETLIEKLLSTNAPLSDTILLELPSSWQRNANMKKTSHRSETFVANKDSFQKGNRRSKPFQSKRR